MGISVQHNYGGGLIGAAYATGVGKAKQRKEKYLIDMQLEQQKLLARRQELFADRVFKYQDQLRSDEIQANRDAARRAHDLDRDRRRLYGDYTGIDGGYAPGTAVAPGTGPVAPGGTPGSTTPTAPTDPRTPRRAPPDPVGGGVAPPDAATPAPGAPPVEMDPDERIMRNLDGKMYTPENEKRVREFNSTIESIKSAKNIEESTRQFLLDQAINQRDAVPTLSAPRSSAERDAEESERSKVEDEARRKYEQDKADADKRRKDYMDMGHSAEEARNRYPDPIDPARTTSPFDTSVPTTEEAMKDPVFRKWLEITGKNWGGMSDAERSTTLREYQKTGGWSGSDGTSAPTAEPTAGPMSFTDATDAFNAGSMSTDDYLKVARQEMLNKTISDKEYVGAVQNAKRREVITVANGIYDALGGTWDRIEDVPDVPVTVNGVEYPSARKALRKALEELKKMGTA